MVGATGMAEVTVPYIDARRCVACDGNESYPKSETATRQRHYASHTHAGTHLYHVAIQDALGQ